jgi:hypothetical protein
MKSEILSAGMWTSFSGKGEEPIEMRGEVVAIHGDFLCIRSLHIIATNQDPFHGRHIHHVHLITKKAA